MELVRRTTGSRLAELGQKPVSVARLPWLRIYILPLYILLECAHCLHSENEGQARNQADGT
jgi:hypothetical protein